MDTVTVSGIIIATFGALVLGMAVLIKTMVLSKIDDLQEELATWRIETQRRDEEKQKDFQGIVSRMTGDIQELRDKFIKLETQHDFCFLMAKAMQAQTDEMR